MQRLLLSAETQAELRLVFREGRSFFAQSEESAEKRHVSARGGVYQRSDRRSVLCLSPQADVRTAMTSTVGDGHVERMARACSAICQGALPMLYAFVGETERAARLAPGTLRIDGASRSQCTMRMLCYHGLQNGAEGEAEGAELFPPHTDMSTVSVLFCWPEEEDAPAGVALEVCNADGKWTPVHRGSNSGGGVEAIAMFGGVAGRLSKGALQATRHRVVRTTSATRSPSRRSRPNRLSLALFIRPPSADAIPALSLSRDVSVTPDAVSTMRQYVSQHFANLLTRKAVAEQKLPTMQVMREDVGRHWLLLQQLAGDSGPGGATEAFPTAVESREGAMFWRRELRKYVLFLQLRHRFPFVQPPRPLAWLWLAHMLQPTAYQRDCVALVGAIVPFENEHLEFDCPLFRSLWMDMYGFSYDKADAVLQPPGAGCSVLPESAVDALASSVSFCWGLGVDTLMSLWRNVGGMLPDVCNETEFGAAGLPCQASWSAARTAAFWAEVLAEYHKFQVAATAAPTELLEPGDFVDLVWHTHMCTPQRYVTDTSVNHFPFDARWGAEMPMDQRERTLAAWNQVLGEAPKFLSTEIHEGCGGCGGCGGGGDNGPPSEAWGTIMNEVANQRRSFSAEDLRHALDASGLSLCTKSPMPDEQLQALIMALDSDGDGMLSECEFFLFFHLAELIHADVGATTQEWDHLYHMIHNVFQSMVAELRLIQSGVALTERFPRFAVRPGYVDSPVSRLLGRRVMLLNNPDPHLVTEVVYPVNCCGVVEPQPVEATEPGEPVNVVLYPVIVLNLRTQQAVQVETAQQASLKAIPPTHGIWADIWAALQRDANESESSTQASYFGAITAPLPPGEPIATLELSEAGQRADTKRKLAQTMCIPYTAGCMGPGARRQQCSSRCCWCVACLGLMCPPGLPWHCLAVVPKHCGNYCAYNGEDFSSHSAALYPTGVLLSMQSYSPASGYPLRVFEGWCGNLVERKAPAQRLLFPLSANIEVVDAVNRSDLCCCCCCFCTLDNEATPKRVLLDGLPIQHFSAVRNADAFVEAIQAQQAQERTTPSDSSDSPDDVSWETNMRTYRFFRQKGIGALLELVWQPATVLERLRSTAAARSAAQTGGGSELVPPARTALETEC